VLCLSPHLPMDESNEASAFAILLLYSDWGTDGEPGLNGINAVCRLQQIKKQLPAHILRSLERIQRSEAILADSGEPELADEDEVAAVCTGFEDVWDEPYDHSAAASMSTLPDVGRVTTGAPLHQVAFLRAYVESVKASHTANREAATTMSAEERLQRAVDPDLFIPVASANERQVRLEEEVKQLNSDQLRAYNTAVSHISGQTGCQMVMFLSGEGGTGKSKLIGAICAYTQLLHGKTLGSWGATLITAPTGGAAHNIGGSTWHSALSKAPGKPKTAESVSQQTGASLLRRAMGTALFVLDEISLLACEDLSDINSRLGVATNNRASVFGGLHTLLVGDFYQMKPVMGPSLVQTDISPNNAEATMGRAIFADALTDFCMLKVNVRASTTGNGQLSALARFCNRVRVGDVSNAVVMSMNDRVENNVVAAMRHAHPGALWITSTHSKVADINSAFKERRLNNNEHMFTIVARHVPREAGTPALTPQVRRKLYSEGGDRRGRRHELMLSHMDLFIGSRVRLTRNLFVGGGLYNGAMGTVWGFVFRGEGTLPLTATGCVRLFGDMEDKQREIPVVLVQMDGDEHSFTYSCSTTVPRLVPITEVRSAKLVCGEYVRLQLPILPAEARTAHSVQGYTAQHGVVVDPGSTFFAGDYIAISRAKCKEDVILLSPLQEKSFANKDHDDYRAAIDTEYKRLETKFPQV
jgi:hypothetical protein